VIVVFGAGRRWARRRIDSLIASSATAASSRLPVCESDQPKTCCSCSTGQASRVKTTIRPRHPFMLARGGGSLALLLGPLDPG
jgi:hypothetical protein